MCSTLRACSRASQHHVTQPIVACTSVQACCVQLGTVLRAVSGREDDPQRRLYTPKKTLSKPNPHSTYHMPSENARGNDMPSSQRHAATGEHRTAIGMAPVITTATALRTLPRRNRRITAQHQQGQQCTSMQSTEHQALTFPQNGMP
jgi:hypothetical protein